MWAPPATRSVVTIAHRSWIERFPFGFDSWVPVVLQCRLPHLASVCVVRIERVGMMERCPHPPERSSTGLPASVGLPVSASIPSVSGSLIAGLSTYTICHRHLFAWLVTVLFNPFHMSLTWNTFSWSIKRTSRLIYREKSRNPLVV